MRYYVCYDAYGNAKEAISEEDLASRFGNNPEAILKQMLGSWAGEGAAPGKGHVSVVNFDTDQERDAFLETIGQQISSYGGCRSQCQ